MSRRVRRDPKHHPRHTDSQFAGYRYDFPLRAFSLRPIPSRKTAQFFSKFLIRNPYYQQFTPADRRRFRERVRALSACLPYFRTIVRRLAPGHRIVSLYAYGSFLYGHADYHPNDIDIGVVTSGSCFKYDLRRIQFPTHIASALPVPIRQINIFIYGFDNLVNGTPIHDTVRGHTLHRDTVKRELSVGYWRNVVIQGKDFMRIKADLLNTWITMHNNLERVRIRLNTWGKSGLESSEELLQKVASRLYEANVFAAIFHRTTTKHIDTWSSWPVDAQRGMWSIEKARDHYIKTRRLYSLIRKQLSRYA